MTAPAPIPARDWRPTAWGRLRRLCHKELRETLRDRRTLTTLLLMPLLVYPLLSIVFHRFVLTSRPGTPQVALLLAVRTEEEEEQVRGSIEFGEVMAHRQAEAREAPFTPAPEHRWMRVADPAAAVASGEIDLGVLLDKPADTEFGSVGLRFTLIYREESELSRAALDFVRGRLQVVNEAVFRDHLVRAGQVPHTATETRQQAVEAIGPPFSLQALVPLILILMTITGAVYPSIDLTAGERERGTLEMLMAAPVPRLGLLIAKYVAVLTVAVLTATANLVSMTITLASTGLTTVVFGAGGFSLTVVCQIFLLLLLFAAFFSAIMLALTSFARSFKEAQAYLIPLMLLSLGPGMLSLMPDLSAEGILAVAPVVNIVLLARDVLAGVARPFTAGVTVVSTALYAASAVALAARIFGSDAILYGTQAGWSDLLRARQRDQRRASVSSALFVLAMLFPLFFLLANLLGKVSASMAMRLGINAAATIVLFGLLPLAAARWQGVRVATAFRLRPPRLLTLPAAILLGLALWPIAHELFWLNEWLGIRSLTAEHQQQVARLLAEWKLLSPLGIVAALAIVAPCCEEFFFRGYLFSAIRGAASGWKTVLVCGVLFGMFHIATSSALQTERLIPSTFMGLVLGWVCLRSQSIWPGVVVHALHNGTLVLAAYYRNELLARGLNLGEGRHLPAWLMATAAAALSIGVLWLWAATRETSSEPGCESASAT